MIGLLNELNRFDFITTVDKDDQYRRHIENRMTSYIEIVNKITNEYDEDLNDLKCYLLKCFDYMINGEVMNAHKKVVELFSLFHKKFYVHDMDLGNSINIYRDVNKFLYKGRVGGWEKKYDRKDIFHIPFNKRELIKTQRFSIPGVPSLYLSHSIMGVWEELNRPSLDELFVSRFEISEDIKVLDLGLCPFDFDIIKSSLSDPFNELYPIRKKLFDKFILTNLIKIVSLVRIEAKSRYFKSEYVLPQILLLVGVEMNLFDGIRYPSVKVNSDSYIFSNYVLPAFQKEKNDFYSTYLTSKIKLTLPINIGIYNNLLSAKKVSTEDENLYRKNTIIKLNDDLLGLYGNSYFYELEMKLLSEKGNNVNGIFVTSDDTP